uniref:ATP synthase YMF19-like N-terminal domain-containing protein n=1 Tax=Capsicum annuum TaxID=4072 RepID=A0A075VWU7_CAPAN|nr:hypothetical protein [Capsicum annuum]
MPQLDKFTSFTQFFWSCLFYVIIVLLRFLNIDERLYFLYVKNSAFQRVVLYLKFFVIFSRGFSPLAQLQSYPSFSLWDSSLGTKPSGVLSETVGPRMGGICTSSAKNDPDTFSHI